MADHLLLGQRSAAEPRTPCKGRTLGPWDEPTLDQNEMPPHTRRRQDRRGGDDGKGDACRRPAGTARNDAEVTLADERRRQ